MKLKTKPANRTSGPNPLENIIGYILTLILSFLFALFCSWRIGIFLLLSFLLAPVISIGVTLMYAKLHTFSVIPSKDNVGKNERFFLTVNVKNPLFFPSPTFLFYVNQHPCVKYSAPCYGISVMPFQTECFNIQCTSKIAGLGQVGIADIRIQDYLGIFSLSLKQSYTYSLSVVPDIDDISPDEDFIRQTYVLSSSNSESEDTIEVSTNVMGAFPGYEHREYIPGDPLKRINWKLSARKDKLFVRLDDELATSSVTMVIDPLLNITKEDMDRLPSHLYPESDQTVIPHLIGEHTLEAALGIARAFLCRNLRIKCIYKREGSFHTMELNSANDITLLQQEFASLSFEGNVSERFPFSQIPELEAVFVCTSNKDTAVALPGAIVYSALAKKGRLI